MATKAELQAENDLLQKLTGKGTVIKDCVFHGSPSAEVVSAVLQIAVALEHAARALQGNPSLVIKGVE